MLTQSRIMQSANGFNESDKTMDGFTPRNGRLTAGSHPALKDRLPQPPNHGNHISHPQYPESSLAAQQFAQSAAAVTTNGVSGRPGAQPHGYGGPQVGEQDAHIHPELRSLRDSTASQGQGPAPTPDMMQAGVPPHSEGGGMVGGPSQPSSSVSPSMESAEMGDVIMADGRKAKRELSQSKRAAQNRAAQRAFRQRKELYIRKLEQEVRDYEVMEGNYKELQTENYALRQYIINLQSRLLDAHGEYPQPPPGLRLTPHHAHSGAPPATSSNVEPAQAAPAAPDAGTSLEVVAQAVAGLARGEAQAGLPSHPSHGVKGDHNMDDDSKADEEIGRQLQADGLPSAQM